MLCPRCGNPDQNTRFCRHCGLELRLTQSSIAAIAGAEGAWAAGPAPVSVHQLEWADALLGRTLDQRYYLESKLGVGGMGSVYCARRLLIGDQVAIKVLHADLVADLQAVERCRRETQAAAMLQHPNIVTIYDFGVSGEGLVYLVMELVEGETLRSIIRKQGPLDEVVAAEIARQICAALDEAHRYDLVHRDLKPENIMVQNTAGGLHVKVLDFGLANLRDLTSGRLATSGRILGTPHYMSPEQCQGEELDGRSDIYSLGIVLFEMLTGSVPFNSPMPTAIVVKHVNQLPLPLRNLNANISPAVEAVVLRALGKWREARPQTAGDFAEEMLSAVKGASGPWSLPGSLPGSPPVTLNGHFGSAPAYDAAPLEDVPASFWGDPEPGSFVAPAEELPSFEIPAEKKAGRLAPLLTCLLLILAVVLGFWLFTGSRFPSIMTTADPAANSQAGDLPASAVETGPPGSKTEFWEVGQTTGTINPENAIGEPDQKMATLKPGGKLALVCSGDRFFGDGPGADLHLAGPEQGRVSYTVFVKDDPGKGWRQIDINRRGILPGGADHDMGHHGVRRARLVMIRNDANTDLKLDVVTAMHKEAIPGESRPHNHR